MKVEHLHIENYKGLREVDIPLSRFACLIGENNAGKSSILQAIALFFSGAALAKSHFFNSDAPIRIAFTFADITNADISSLAEEHRSKIQAIIKNGSLTLVRVYGSDGKSTLKYRKLLPRDERFSDDKIAELVKSRKAGKSFVDAVVAIFTELDGVVTAGMNQGDMKAEIQKLADSLPDEQKSPADVELPTGIDASIKPLLPEPIYIPAVKDFSDDVKTKESTPFGKVLKILLEAIEPHLAEERDLFEKLNSKLNRTIGHDGTEKDERLQQVKTIEQTVEGFVRDTFNAVKLRIEIPPPELKSVLSSAQIYANDGVDGLIDTKGDGLRRAIVFAILRSYVELSRTGLIPSGEAQGQTSPKYLLLFEEPELYLHPKAQQILFEALGKFSQKHPVITTTHSPAFFGPQSTTTFVKIRKQHDSIVATKPFAITYPVDLGETNARDQFQIICYENNHIAFFADTVVLVEGDSDFIVLPHLARVINPSWDVGQRPIRFARIGGKGNIRRYKEFFERFKTRVFVVADLDFIVGSEFNQISPTEEMKSQRSNLFSAIDALIEKNGGTPEPNGVRIKAAQERADLRAIWSKARDLMAKQKSGQASIEDVAAAVDEFFAWEKYWGRRDMLSECPDTGLLAQKRAFLDDLRRAGVFVLEKGAIDDYYPADITGDNKPTKAQSLVNAIATKDRALALCNVGHKGPDGAETSEFEAIFKHIFGH